MTYVDNGEAVLFEHFALAHVVGVSCLQASGGFHARSADHFFSKAFQFTTTLIGEGLESSTGKFNSNRPSGE
jgi:hypothetical protein